MTGARLGELLNLRRSEVNLAKRMITLSPNRTKEGHWKKIPVHRELVPVIEDALRVTSMEHDLLFLQRDHRGIRSAHPEALKSAWQRACKRLGFEKPWPRFHDLRHTWRTNARRSRLDYQVAEAIMGHQAKVRSVADRYGVISDEELLEAIDQMTFDHGETEILVAGHGQRFSGDTSNIRGNKNATFVAPKKKGHAAT
jgi:integrase